MKVILKRIAIFVICIVFVIDGGRVCAKDSNNIGNKSIDFITMFYSGSYDIMVTNSQEEDVTSCFLSKTQNLFDMNRIEEIKDIIAQDDLVLHVISYDNFSRAYDKFKTVRSDMIYFELLDQNKATRICVTAELSGGIWYDENTSKVTKVSNATYNILSIDTNTGLSVTTNNFSTGSNVQSGKGYFWGRCGFVSQGQIVDNGIPYTTYLEYGPKTVSFYATP